MTKGISEKSHRTANRSRGHRASEAQGGGAAAELRTPEASSEEMLARTLASAGIGTWEIAPSDSWRIHWSGTTSEIFGLDCETEMFFEDLLALVYPHDRALLQDALESALNGEGRGHYSCECRVIRQDGVLRWVSLKGRRLCNRGHNAPPPLLLGTVMDVTARKLAEKDRELYAGELENRLQERDRVLQNLRESEERVRLLLNSTAEAIFGIDLAGICTFCNPACARLLGYGSPTELTGKNMHSVLHRPPRSRKSAPGEDYWIAKAFDNLGGSHGDDEVFHRKDGSLFPAEYWSYPVWREGQRIGAVVTFLDLTERKQAAAQIQNLAAIVESTDDAIVGMDLHGVVVSWNSAASKLFGYAPQEALGRPIAALVAAGPGNDLNQILDGVRRGGPIHRFEIQRRSEDGRTVDVSLSISPVRNTQGTIVRSSIIARDVSGQREMERHYRQVQKMEAVGQLAGGIAHDFNNLLMIIRNCAHLIESQTGDNARVHKYVGQIRDASEKGAAVTRQLLAFSRKQAQDLKLMDLNTVATQFSRMLPHLLGEQILLQVVPLSRAALVRADQSQLELVIMNLCINARDAMPSGGELFVEVDQVEFTGGASLQPGGDIPPGHYVMLAVTDTGEGMNADTLARLFDPFFTTKEVGKGTGLGLATVYGIVQQNGGHIRVYSEPGKGSTFKVYLPRADAESVPQAEAEKVLPSGRRTGTILLVEDQPSLREVLGDFLESLGYTVHSAASGAEAIEVCKADGRTIDLLLTDVVMPAMSGPDLERAVCALRPQVQTIFMSGYSNQVLKRENLKSSAVLLQKPFDMSLLESKISLLLSGGHAAGK